MRHTNRQRLQRRADSIAAHPTTSLTAAALVLATAAADVRASEPLRMKLPFPPGSTFRCSQGNEGEMSHADAHNRYAYDFDMPEGTPVLAAAAGRVVLASDSDTSPGSQSPEARQRGNWVRIDHGDGRFTEYGHLQAHSLQVVAGQLVSAAQFLARSGNSGYSAGPHLHFGVNDCVQRSLPSAFLDVAENGGVPNADSLCTSKNDGLGASWFQADSNLALDAFASTGITLESTIPAAYWNRFEPYTLRGRREGGALPVCFFLTGIRPTPMVCATPDGSGAFALVVRIADFDAPADALGSARYGVTVPTGSELVCETLGTLAIWNHDYDAVQKQFVAPLRLPFAPGRLFRYANSTVEERAHAFMAVRLFVPPGTPVLACAAGRVVSVEARETTSTAGDAQSPQTSAITRTITLDHGDGVLTEYDLLEPADEAVNVGQIVRAGQTLGTSGRPGSVAEPHVLLRVFAQPGGSQPRFAQLGAAQQFADKGVLECPKAVEPARVFRADSTASVGEFPGSGITALAGLPARTFHAHTTYRAEGTVDAAAASVNFVVRRRGATTERRVSTGWVRDGAFAFSIRIGDVGEFASEHDSEWSLRVMSSASESAPLVWLPLVVVR